MNTMNLRRSFSNAVVLIAFLVFLPACGYQREGQRSVAQPHQRLYIELLKNRTNRAFVNDMLTARLVERFSRSPIFTIVESPINADLILSGDLVRYESAAVAYDRDDAIVAYRVDLEVEMMVRRGGTDGYIVWRGGRSDSKDYAADPERSLQQNAERSAVAFQCERLVDDLYVQITDGLSWQGTGP